MSYLQRHSGSLWLDLMRLDGRTSIARQRSHPPLQTFGVQEADARGGAYLQILNPCGGLFEGDRAEIEVSLQPGAHLYLTTQAATKVYPAEHGQVTRQHLRLRVARGAILEYFPLPLIPFAGALYAQDIDIRIQADGICLVAEVLAPGRSARGERFAYQMVHSRVQAWVDEGLVLWEQLRLQPARSPLTGLGVLDGHSYVATVYVLTSRHLDPWLRTWNHRLTGQYGESIGITALASGGLVVRLLADSGQAALRCLETAHRLIREEGLGLPPLQVYRAFD